MHDRHRMMGEATPAAPGSDELGKAAAAVRELVVALLRRDVPDGVFKDVTADVLTAVRRLEGAGLLAAHIDLQRYDLTSSLIGSANAIAPPATVRSDRPGSSLLEV